MHFGLKGISGEIAGIRESNGAQVHRRICAIGWTSLGLCSELVRRGHRSLTQRTSNSRPQQVSWGGAMLLSMDFVGRRAVKSAVNADENLDTLLMFDIGHRYPGPSWPNLSITEI